MRSVCVRPSWVVLVAISALACSGRNASSRTAEETKPSADCGPDCGPMDACIDGICRRNPFMHGAEREEPLAETASAACPYPAGKIPPPDRIPDAKVPEYDPARTRVVDLKAGNERLSDHVLDEHLQAIHPRLMECIDLGACYSESPLLGGRFDFSLRVAGSGTVTEASVTTSPQLNLAPVVACARRSVAEVRFPKFDGSMTVTYSVVID